MTSGSGAGIPVPGGKASSVADMVTANAFSPARQRTWYPVLRCGPTHVRVRLPVALIDMPHVRGAPIGIAVGNKPKSEKKFELPVRDAHLCAQADILRRRTDENFIDAVINRPTVFRR